MQVKYTYRYRANAFPIVLNPSGKSQRGSFGDQAVDAALVRVEGAQLDLLINGEPVSAVVSFDGANRWVTVNGRTILLEKTSGLPKTEGPGAHPAGHLLSPMPGQVRAIQVLEGDQVSKGQTVLIVEAMKMEMKIVAQTDGLLKKLSVQVGQKVDRDQLLGIVQGSAFPPEFP